MKTKTKQNSNKQQSTILINSLFNKKNVVDERTTRMQTHTYTRTRWVKWFLFGFLLPSRARRVKLVRLCGKAAVKSTTKYSLANTTTIYRHTLVFYGKLYMCICKVTHFTFIIDLIFEEKKTFFARITHTTIAFWHDSQNMWSNGEKKGRVSAQVFIFYVMEKDGKTAALTEKGRV